METYLGTKGYTIPKASLSVEQQKNIKNDLTIKPYVPGAPGANNAPTFPAFRESALKLYVPHYYGVEKFGPPKSVKTNEGVDVDLEFNGTLRDYQRPVVEKFINHVKNSPPKGGLLELPCAWGKTSASLYILSQLKKKAIVIVHKEFLMNQWIERIQQFIPKARIGKIQGPTVDVDDKDIVLCMLQSLISKDYPATLFDCFGLTIIDEVHHISSQTFSNALFKVVTKYMLGLSATMERKDGTTKVFKMFLGNVVHKAERKNDGEVEVRALTYKTNDAEFNQTILDFKGQPQISSMISKLSTYNRRTEFIIQAVTDFIQVDTVDKSQIETHKKQMDADVPCCEICAKRDNYLMKNTCCGVVKYCMPCLKKVVALAEQPEVVVDKKGNEKTVKRRPKCPSCNKVVGFEQHYIENPFVKPLEQQHTIIMSHNLNVLEYMYNKFVCRNLASVGYYVGGMSEEELKKSETKQVILATYSMCSEGLDIPTLNAEFLISPKTDIVQSVGRILRAKHATNHPIIYDIVDTHDVFHRQWLKRKSYYKKQNYRIIGTNSVDYNRQPILDTSTWAMIFDPANKKGGKKSSILEEDSDDETSTLSGGCLLKFKK